MKPSIAVLVLVATFAVDIVSADDASDRRLAELGRTYAEAINLLDVEALDGLISAQHLAQRAADIAADTPDEKREFQTGFAKSIPNLNRITLTELERQGVSARYLRILEFDGIRGPLVRFDFGDGFNYVLLSPVRASRGDDTLLVSNIYYATTGEWLSESLGVATKLMTAPSENFLGKLFGVESINQNLVSTLKQVVQLRQEHRLAEAFDLLNALEGDVRNNRIILMNTIQLTVQLDEDLYRDELRRLAEHHRDNPKVAFMLLDHFFYENEMDAAMAAVDLMEQTYGPDAIQGVTRASIEYEKGQLGRALDEARKAVRLEPDYEQARWVLVSILVEAGMYTESVAALQAIQDDLGHAFSREDFENDPIYSEFVKSSDFKQWFKTN